MMLGFAAACADTVSPRNTVKLRIISRHVSIAVDCNPENIQRSKYYCNVCLILDDLTTAYQMSLCLQCFVRSSSAKYHFVEGNTIKSFLKQMLLLAQGLVQRLQLPLQVGWKLVFNVVHKI
jgi:hypothetical protein